MKIVVFGAKGQVASALKEVYSDKAEFVSQEKVNFNRPKEVIDYLEVARPSLVINAAAYTAVDQAESEPDIVNTINGVTPGEIAKWCAANKSLMIHYSTDYVFSGEQTGPYIEDSQAGSLNIYGSSKLLGEQLIAEARGNFLIFRTSWVYSHTGNNFVKTMLRLGSERKSLKIVSDQRGSPTYAVDIAQATEMVVSKLQLTNNKIPAGIYHMTAQNTCSWHQFALTIFDNARTLGFPLKIKQIEPISSQEYPTPARRPLNSQLSNEKLKAEFNIQLPTWQSSLYQCLTRLKNEGH